MEQAWMIALILQWIFLLLLALMMVGVLRYLSFVQRNIHLVIRYASRFEPGDKITHFELADLNGLPVLSKNVLRNNEKTLLLFLNGSCSSCKKIVKYVADLAKREGGLKGLGWAFVFIYVGLPLLSTKEQINSLPLDEVTVLIDEKGVLLGQYDLRSFPVGIAVDNSGYVIDQSTGPTLNWLYQVLAVPSP